MKELEMTKRYDTAYFIERARKVHGNKYRYHKVEYTTTRSHVVIDCPKHGEFKQTPESHLTGKGCKACGYEQSSATQLSNTDKFIKRAKGVHGDLYDYSKVVYKGALKKVVIICRLHGEFNQTPSKHYGGQGCLECGRSALRKTTSQFVAEAKEVHGDKYSYAKSRYIDNTKKMVITCNGCGEDFKQTSQAHLAGKGCPSCNKGCVRKTTEQFVAEAIARHGNRYGYQLVDYQSNIKPVKILCKKHGYFEQAPWSHIKGHGCLKCSHEYSGFDRKTFIKQCNKNNEGRGLLYIISCRKGAEQFYKVGITSRSLEARFSSVTIMPYEYGVEYLIEDRGELIYDLEYRLHNLLKNNKHKPSISFAGETECFTDIKPIEKLIRGLQNTEQLQLLA